MLDRWTPQERDRDHDSMTGRCEHRL